MAALLCVGLVLAGCGTQEAGQAEFLHGTFYFALLEEQDVCVVFSEEYDEEEAGAVLTDESECIRLEGRLGELLSGFDSEMEREAFVAGVVPAGESVPAYHEEEGAGTAYYVADHYRENMWQILRAGDDRERKIEIL